MKSKTLILLFAILITTSSKTFSQIKSIDTGKLVSFMEGSFSSEEQSKNDSDYYDIRLHMKKDLAGNIVGILFIC